MSDPFVPSPFEAPPDHLVVEARQADLQVVLVRLIGELDLAGAERVREALAGVRAPVVVVELADLRFIDAAGVRSLLGAAEDLARRGQSLEIRGATGIVRRVFEILGLSGMLGT